MSASTPATGDDRPLTVAEAAEWLKTSPSTVYAMCAAGKLGHFRVGIGRGTIRIRKADLLKLTTQSAGPEPRVTLEMLEKVGESSAQKRKRHLGF